LMFSNRAMERQRLTALGDVTSVGGVVICLDMLTRAGNGDRVLQLENVEVQGFEDGRGSAQVMQHVRPVVESLLCPAENLFYAGVAFQVLAKSVGLPLIGQRQLVA